MAEIDRAAALALINQQNSSEIFEQAAATSAALRTFRTVPMSSKQTRMPVIDALPSAGFITGDTGRKLTTAVGWANKILEAEEIATIVPIPENVFDDSAFNVWDAVRPRIAEAIGAVLDGAVLFGTGAPSSWPDSMFEGAVAAGNKYSIATTGDLAEDLNQTEALVAQDGFDPNVLYARTALRYSLRGLRDTQGMPIYSTSLKDDGMAESVYGVPLETVRNGSWIAPSGTAGTPVGAHAMYADRDKFILGLRQDMTMKILTEATLTDGAGAVVFSLAEQDMIALRVKFRVGFQVADPTTLEGGSSAYPASVLTV